MYLGWILFCAMKTLGSYIIPVGIFYQLLIKKISFSCNIYLTIDNMIITTHVIMMLYPSIFHNLNCYFESIKISWLLNSNRQPCQNLLKKYRKQLYRQKIKISKFFQTNNQLLEKTDETTCPMTTQHPEINRNFLSNLRCHLDPKKHRRKRFDTNSFDICADSSASSCATPDKIDFIPGTYKNLTGVIINGISEGIKVAG